jgi:hypothetical protein
MLKMKFEIPSQVVLIFSTFPVELLIVYQYLLSIMLSSHRCELYFRMADVGNIKARNYVSVAIMY